MNSLRGVTLSARNTGDGVSVIFRHYSATQEKEKKQVPLGSVSTHLSN